MALQGGSGLTDVAGRLVEIYNATRVVARHVDDPSERHWQAALQIIKYALGTEDQGLTFERRPNLDLSVYKDANYVEKADGRRSASGVAVTVGNSTVSGVIVHRTLSFGEEHQGVGRQRRGYQPSSKPPIDVRFHFIRELVKTGMIAVEHIPTKEQRADILTKALVGTIFREHRNFLLNLHK